jgi:hypothetical protein
MKAALRIVTSIFLLFNATGALYGGWNLMTHPDGSSLQMSPGYLQHSPFSDYFIPGIILFAANGLFSLFVFILLLSDHKKLPLLVIVQGSILVGWIVTQVLMVQMVYYLHIVMGMTGLLLLLCGALLLKMKRPNYP